LKHAENGKNDLFPLTLSETGMPAGHRKLEKLSELLGKL